MDRDARIDELRSRLDFEPNRSRAWKWGFTETERQALLVEAQRAAGQATDQAAARLIAFSGRELCRAFAMLHKLDESQAVIELAHRAVMIFAPERDALSGATSAPQLKPRLETDGRLTLGAILLGQIRPGATKTRAEQLLRAFERKGWPEAVERPFGNEVNGQAVYDAVCKLNGKLDGIRFATHRKGVAVSWRFVPNKGQGGQDLPATSASE